MKRADKDRLLSRAKTSRRSMQKGMEQAGNAFASEFLIMAFARASDHLADLIRAIQSETTGD